RDSYSTFSMLEQKTPRKDSHKKMAKISGLLLFLAVGLSACGTLTGKPTPSSEIYFTRSWTRATVGPKYMGFLQPATVSPLLTKKTVIEANGVDSLKAYKKDTGH